MDALHVLFGVLAQLAVAFLTGRPVSRWMPWAVVLLLEILNELSDLSLDQWPDPGIQYAEAVKDIVLTMLLPTVILSVSRRKPRVLIRCETRSPVDFIP